MNRTYPRHRSLAAACLLAVVLWGVAASCAGCGVFGESPNAAHIQSDRAFFNAVAPEYSGYVNADPKLTADQKARRQRTLDAKRLEIQTQIREGTTAAPVPAAPPTVQPIP